MPVSDTQPAIALATLHAGYHHSALALHTLAAFCCDEPFHPGLTVHEGLVRGRQDGLLAELVARRPRLVGFSTYLWNIQPVLRLVRNLRQLLPETVIVLGGPEAGPRGEELLANEAAVDYVIAGEGEQPFRDLARFCLGYGGHPGGIAGLVWRDGQGGGRANPPRPLPAVAWRSPYTCGIGVTDKPLIYWETSRGCPFRCTFCTSSNEALRTASAEQVAADLAIFSRLRGPRTIKLLDRSFHLGTVRTLDLLKRFLDTPENLRFHLELNPDRISDEAMALFARAPAGKFQFEIGVQTLAIPVLERIERAMDVPRAMARIDRLVALRRHPVHLDLIVGLPGEDAASCRRSLDETFRLGAEHLQLGILKLLPGTPLRQQAARFGYRWDREPPYEILGHDALPFAALMRLKHHAELLERLWNSGLMNHGLARLVTHHFGGSVSDCFDHLLAGPAAVLATDRAQPDRVFGLVVEAFQRQFARDDTLVELMLWDYAHFSLVTGKTPPWIAGRLRARERRVPRSGNRRMPVLTLGAAAAADVSRRRAGTLAEGVYAVWPQRDRKGRPAEVIAVGAV